MHLLLFDIDGTLLLRAAGGHAQALKEALTTVYGIDPGDIRSVPTAGRTDPQIARQILLEAGVPAARIDAGLDDLRAEACSAYARLCEPDLSATVSPGVTELLDALAARDDVVLALVTGNLEPIARLKLARAGLGGYFPAGLGGFGSDHEDRTELPAVARRRAGSRNAPFARERTIVIGDTPLDILCARADDVRCVAVATGPHAVDELAEADEVVTDARGIGDALTALGV